MTSKPQASAPSPEQQKSSQEITLPEPVSRRGITEFQWRTLCNNLFPGAEPQSVIMVWDYCKARGLDPLKKPCHIVPMQVTVKTRGNNGQLIEKKEWRDVVMPGIYEYRTTAARTGLYAGMDPANFGPECEFKGVKVPEFCDVTVYRIVGGVRCPFTHRAYFAETCATKSDGNLNSMWTKRPRGQLEKCAEAGALRKAFPEDLGGEHTVEEMEGRTIDVDAEGNVLGVTQQKASVQMPGRKSETSHEPTVAQPQAGEVQGSEGGQGGSTGGQGDAGEN